jgi:hypothetical protein
MLAANIHAPFITPYTPCVKCVIRSAFEKGDRGGFYCFVGTQNRVSISVFENREEAKKEK